LLSFFHNGIWTVDVDAPAKKEALCYGAKVSIKVFLEGPYSTDGSRAGSTIGQMTPSLTTPTLYVPTAQPYGASPYVYDASTNPNGFKYIHGGTVITPGGSPEATTTAVLTGSNGVNIGANAIVDWVFLELRDPTTPATILETRAALLQADGDVVDVDGVSPVDFNAVNTVACGSYHIAVRHRNHLGIRTAVAESLSNVTTIIDFTTTSTTYVYGTNPRKTMSNGAFAMYAGNVVIGPQPRELSYSGPSNDRFAIFQTIGGVISATVFGYYAADVNMNSEVSYSGPGNDRFVIFVNLGGVIAVTLVEQL
jgi:hypothetical protein